jgi:hypothetical protein
LRSAVPACRSAGSSALKAGRSWGSAPCSARCPRSG